MLDAGEEGVGQSCGAFMSLAKELGQNPKDNGKPLKSFKWSRHMTDLYFRSGVAGEWITKSSSGIY